jgi:hypothetical protein
MIKCYNTYDKEYIFRDKGIVEKNFTRFKTVEIRRSGIKEKERGGITEIIITENDTVKWKSKQCLFFGKVLGFQVRKVLGPTENVYVGTGSLIYQRLPLETYGETEAVLPLDVLDIRDFKVSFFFFSFYSYSYMMF